MGFNICAWTSCLSGQKEEEINEKQEHAIPYRKISGPMVKDVRASTPEKKKIPVASGRGSRPGSPRTTPIKRSPPPPPPISSVVSVPSKFTVRTERDLPPLPPVSSIYELGMPTPHHGLTRSNSGHSVSSTKNRKRRTQNFDMHRSTTVAGTSSSARRGKEATSGAEPKDYRTANENRKSVVRPLVLSIHEDDGKMEPLPDFSRRPPMPRSKTYDDSPIACKVELTGYQHEKATHRRSDSAPIPVPGRTDSTRSTEPRIRRKPVSPQNSVSRGGHAIATTTNEWQQNKNPFELESPAVELSADPKSRTQSYYADAGAQLLVATLSEPPPVPDLPPNLSLDTAVRPHPSTFDTPTSKHYPFTPLTTWNSPIEDPYVSPITPATSRGRMGILKRSRSMGPSSAPSREVSLKRHSMEDAPPLPTLPSTVYIAPTDGAGSRGDSLSKTGSTVDSSRRTSNSSSASETSSQSSQPSPTSQITSGPQQQSEQEASSSQATILNRNSAYAPIPLILDAASDFPTPPVPKLPPQAYTFFSARRRQPIQSRTSELMRSISTENLRARRSSAISTGRKDNSVKDGDNGAKRSKSTFYPVSEWSGDISSPSSSLPPPPPLPSLGLVTSSSMSRPEDIPLPSDDDFSDNESEREAESDTKSITITDTRPQRTASTKSLKRDSKQEEYNEAEEDQKDHTVIRDERYGMGLGSAYGVAY